MNNAELYWHSVIEACSKSYDECKEALSNFLESICRDKSKCEPKPSTSFSKRRYEWIEKLIETGVPDGRARLILYVISRYLTNVKGLSVEEAQEQIRIFIQASCEKHGQCSKIYDSWIRNVLMHVKEGGWKPWGLERIKSNDPELYSIVASVLNLE